MLRQMLRLILCCEVKVFFVFFVFCFSFSVLSSFPRGVFLGGGLGFLFYFIFLGFWFLVVVAAAAVLVTSHLLYGVS